MKTNIFKSCLGAVVALVFLASATQAVAQDLWITPGPPPLDNPDIQVWGDLKEGNTVTIHASIHNSDVESAYADIVFEWGFVGSKAAPDKWTKIHTRRYSGPGVDYFVPWHIEKEAVGRSCLRVSITNAYPRDRDVTPANSAFESHDIIGIPPPPWWVGFIGSATAVPILNPDPIIPLDIYIQFNEVHIPEGWEAWISDDLLEQVAPGDTQSVVVYFLPPETAVVGDSAMANIEVFLSSPSGTHIGGRDFKAIITEPQIPTLSEWGMISMFILLLGGIVWFVRRKLAPA